MQRISGMQVYRKPEGMKESIKKKAGSLKTIIIVIRGMFPRILL